MEKIILYPVCKRCHRKLKTLEAQERGYGKVCLQKLTQIEVKQPLFKGISTDKEKNSAKGNTRI